MAVTCKVYRAEDNHMESSAGVFNKLLIAAPFVLVATIGMKARSVNADFDFVYLTQRQNSQISAYGPLVGRTQKLLKNALIAPPKATRKLAQEWLTGGQNGTLQPLTPAVFEDTSRDGVKAEIVRANCSVAEALNIVADDEAARGQYKEAADDSLLAARTVEISKYFDFPSLSICSMVQRRAYKQIKSVVYYLSPKDKARVQSEVSSLRSDPARISEMAIRSRQLFLQYELRHGYTLHQVQGTQRLLAPKEFASRNSLGVKSKDVKLKTDRLDSLTPELLSDVRLGTYSAVETDRKIDGIVSGPETFEL